MSEKDYGPEELNKALQEKFQKYEDRLKEVLEDINDALGFFSMHQGARSAFEELSETKNKLQQLEKKMRQEWKIQPRHESNWQVLQ